MVASAGISPIDLARLLGDANRGHTACWAIRPCLATAKSVLLIRKQPKQNLPNLGRLIGDLLETFHGFQFQAGANDEQGGWGINWR